MTIIASIALIAFVVVFFHMYSKASEGKSVLSQFRPYLTNVNAHDTLGRLNVTGTYKNQKLDFDYYYGLQKRKLIIGSDSIQKVFPHDVGYNFKLNEDPIHILDAIVEASKTKT